MANKKRQHELFETIRIADKKTDRLALLLELGHGGPYNKWFKHTWEYERPWGDTPDEMAIRRLYQDTWYAFGRGKRRKK